MRAKLAGALVEFVGVFGLMLVGGAAILHGAAEGFAPGAGLISVALAHGLILATLVTAGMHISGAQFNPAVSVALVAIGKQRVGEASLYVVAQLLGGVSAAWLLTGMFDASAVESGRLGATLGSMSSGDGADVLMVFVLEAIATALLMFVIMGSAVDRRGVGRSASVGGMAIGLVVAANILCFGPLTGASMNPARSFGPALVGGYWDAHAVYWFAPIVGAVLAALLWRYALGGTGASGDGGGDGSGGGSGG